MSTSTQYVAMPQTHWTNILDKIRDKMSSQTLYTSSQIPNLIDQLYHVVFVTEWADLSTYSDSDIIFIRRDLLRKIRQRIMTYDFSWKKYMPSWFAMYDDFLLQQTL